MKVIDLLTTFDNLEDERIINIYCRGSRTIQQFNYKDLINNDEYNNLTVALFELSKYKTITTDINIYTYDK